MQYNIDNNIEDSAETLARLQNLESKIDKILSHIETAHTSRGAPFDETNHAPSNMAEQLRMFIKNGFFQEPRVAAEITLELSKHGYNGDSALISTNLSNLVKSKWLHRSGKRRSYQYVMKKKT